jgi:AraC-like DNA-binding protein
MSRSSTASRVHWTPIVYFWDGGWIGVGASRGGIVPAHSHHAVQVTLGLDGPIRLRSPGDEWMEAPGGAVLPNVTHEFDGCGSSAAMLFIDPECREGRWLRHSLPAPIAPIARERFDVHVEALLRFHERPPGTGDAAALVAAIAHGLCEGPPPRHRMDERIARALAFIRKSDARGLSLEAVAAEVFLSPSRFAHLFTEEVGLPFRRYLLWRKLSRSMDAFGRGGTLSQAAHAAGFADSAHLTRTFYKMFGIPPTAMLGSAEFHEIPSPFELDLPTAG